MVEDSRCPADVRCIVEGRLIVSATVLGGGWSKQVDLTLGIPVPIADGILTLVDATPPPIARKPPHALRHASPSHSKAVASQAGPEGYDPHLASATTSSGLEVACPTFFKLR